MLCKKAFSAICLTLTVSLFPAYGQVKDIGDMDGRWMFIAASSNKATFFIDPQSIAFEKKYHAWSCWVRILDPQSNSESIQKHLYRKNGSECAVISYISYEISTKNPKANKDFRGNPEWHTVIPDSFAENAWACIKLKLSK